MFLVIGTTTSKKEAVACPIVNRGSSRTPKATRNIKPAFTVNSNVSKTLARTALAAKSAFALQHNER
jgi:hypothetical protein